METNTGCDWVFHVWLLHHRRDTPWCSTPSLLNRDGGDVLFKKRSSNRIPALFVPTSHRVQSFPTIIPVRNLLATMLFGIQSLWLLLLGLSEGQSQCSSKYEWNEEEDYWQLCTGRKRNAQLFYISKSFEDSKGEINNNYAYIKKSDLLWHPFLDVFVQKQTDFFETWHL